MCPKNTLCDQCLIWQVPPDESTGRFVNGTKGILTATSEVDSSFTDTSSALFSLYLSHAEKHDKDQVEKWNADAQGILVFVRSTLLFGFIIPSFTMSGTLTNNYCIIHILDRTVLRCPRHIRGRQLQVFVARSGRERRPPPRTNIPTAWWPLQRDPRSDRSSFDFSFPPI